MKQRYSLNYEGNLHLDADGYYKSASHLKHDPPNTSNFGSIFKLIDSDPSQARRFCPFIRQDYLKYVLNDQTFIVENLSNTYAIIISLTRKMRTRTDDILSTVSDRFEPFVYPELYRFLLAKREPTSFEYHIMCQTGKLTAIQYIYEQYKDIMTLSPTLPIWLNANNYTQEGLGLLIKLFTLPVVEKLTKETIIDLQPNNSLERIKLYMKNGYITINDLASQHIDWSDRRVYPYLKTLNATGFVEDHLSFVLRLGGYDGGRALLKHFPHVLTVKKSDKGTPIVKFSIDDENYRN